MILLVFAAIAAYIPLPAFIIGDGKYCIGNILFIFICPILGYITMMFSAWAKGKKTLFTNVLTVLFVGISQCTLLMGMDTLNIGDKGRYMRYAMNYHKFSNWLTILLFVIILLHAVTRIYTLKQRIINIMDKLFEPAVFILAGKYLFAVVDKVSEYIYSIERDFTYEKDVYLNNISENLYLLLGVIAIWALMKKAEKEGI